MEEHGEGEGGLVEERTYKADMRDPYMGNTLPVRVKMLIFDGPKGRIHKLFLISPEDITMKMRQVVDKDVS